jgi:putative transmembrane protein PGPGW
MIATTFRCIRILTGGVILILGVILALPFVPGPGIPLIILGLVLLSDHFKWAKRALHWAKSKWQHWRSGHAWSRPAPQRTGLQ